MTDDRSRSHQEKFRANRNISSRAHDSGVDRRPRLRSPRRAVHRAHVAARDPSGSRLSPLTSSRTSAWASHEPIASSSTSLRGLVGWMTSSRRPYGEWSDSGTFSCTFRRRSRRRSPLVGSWILPRLRSRRKLEPARISSCRTRQIRSGVPMAARRPSCDRSRSRSAR